MTRCSVERRGLLRTDRDSTSRGHDRRRGSSVDLPSQINTIESTHYPEQARDLAPEHRLCAAVVIYEGREIQASRSDAARPNPGTETRVPNSGDDAVNSDGRSGETRRPSPGPDAITQAFACAAGYEVRRRKHITRLRAES